MREEINKLIENEKSKLSEDPGILLEESKLINFEIFIEDHEDIKEIALTIRLMAIIRKLKDLK